MPAHNEAGHIASNIEETANTLNNFGWQWELIVLDDGSSDDTFEIASQLVKKYPHHLLVKKNAFNIGKGRALRNALKFVTGDYVVFLDADLDLHPMQIRTLFDIMRLNNADIVIGSKLHVNSVVDYPFKRRLMSYFYYLFVKVLFKLPCHDTQTGLKLFKVEVLRRVFRMITIKQFAFDLEVLANAHRLGYRIAEAPIVLEQARSFGGHIGLAEIFTTTIDTLAVFYRMYFLKYYDRIDRNRGKGLAK